MTTKHVIAFGGLSWALDGAAAPVAAVLRLQPAMAAAGARSWGRRRGRKRDGGGRRRDGRGTEGDGGVGRPSSCGRDARPGDSPARTSRSRYPGGAPVLDGLDLTIPAGSSLAIVGQNGAGKTTLAKLLCRLYDPQSGAIEIDGVDLRELDLDVVARARRGRVPGLHPLRAAAARQRRAGRRAGRGRSARRSKRPARRGLAEPRHGARPRLRGRHRSLRAASGSASRWRARLCAVQLGAGRRAARRADRAARRARRSRDLRAHPRRHAALHDDPHLAPLLDRAPRRSDLRARARPRRSSSARTTS